MTATDRTVTVKLEADTTGYTEAMAEATRLANELADALERVNSTRVSVKAERAQAVAPVSNSSKEVDPRYIESQEWIVEPRMDYAKEAIAKAKEDYRKKYGKKAVRSIKWTAKPKR